MKHIVTVTYSDPSHELMSMKGRTKTTNYVVEARNDNEAQLRASSYFRSMGYKIHSATIVEQKKEVPAAPSVLKEEAEQIDEVNSRYNMTQALTPKGSNVKAAVGTTSRDKAATNKYARRISKLTGGEYSKQDVKANLKSLATEETSYIEEKLSVSDGVDKWIHDFVHSDNPKFEGKSKKERIQQALGAYYAAKRGVKEEAEPQLKVGDRVKMHTPNELDWHKREGKLISTSDDGHVVKLKGGIKLLAAKHQVKKINEEVEQIDEAKPTEKEVKMAKGIAYGKRYKAGNMTGAVDAIEKMHKGLSKHPEVKTALRQANEEIEAEAKKAKKEGHVASGMTGHVAEGSEDPSNILGVIKAAAKSKTLAAQKSPKTGMGLSQDNPVNEKGPKDEDITEAVVDAKKDKGESDQKGGKKLAANKEVKSTEKDTEIAKAKEKEVKGKSNKVVLHPEAKHAGVGSMSINTMAVGTSGTSSGSAT